jgi:hypothetical protein
MGLNLASPRFSAKGIGIFGYYSEQGANVSSRRTEFSTGAGIRGGWTGTLTDYLTLGATW